MKWNTAVCYMKNNSAKFVFYVGGRYDNQSENICVDGYTAYELERILGKNRDFHEYN